MHSGISDDLSWMHKCYLCGEPTGEKPKIIRTVVPIEKYPQHADPVYTHWYPVCKRCEEKGELI